MLVRDSHRSYRAYSYAELILITDLCSFGTPVGVTELIFYAELILITDFYSFGTPVRVIELMLIS